MTVRVGTLPANRADAFRNEVNLVRLRKAIGVADKIAVDIDRLFVERPELRRFFYEPFESLNGIDPLQLHRVTATSELLLDLMGLSPLLTLNMRLGEGTGAVLAFHSIEVSVNLFNEMATFAQAQVSGATSS